jgi:hypothetical protein
MYDQYKIHKNTAVNEEYQELAVLGLFNHMSSQE